MTWLKTMRSWLFRDADYFLRHSRNRALRKLLAK